jgi:hypothetical protein
MRSVLPKRRGFSPQGQVSALEGEPLGLLVCSPSWPEAVNCGYNTLNYAHYTEVEFAGFAYCK